MPVPSSTSARGGDSNHASSNAHNDGVATPRKSLALRIRHKLPFPTHIPLFATLTYLGAICLFSISFLVFLNSSLSFVVTDLLGIHDGIGDIVGTLGFVDELVAVVSVIGWGTLSDKIGTRLVAVIGYALVGLSLFLVVQVKNVYPQLLLARMLFSLGASATATMVSAVLPELSTLPPPSPKPVTSESIDSIDFPLDRSGAPASSSTSTRSNHSTTTITSSRSSSSYRRHRPRRSSRQISGSKAPRSISGQLSGLVGFTAGIGALLALAVFLPLPTHFARHDGVSKEQAVKDSFYTVGTIAFIVGIVCFAGLRGGIGGSTSKYWNIWVLLGRREKGKKVENGENSEQSSLLPRTDEADETALEAEGAPNGGNGAMNKIQLPETEETTWKSVIADYVTGLWLAFKAGHEDWRLGLAYLGGFVARASSVGISLFIPLYVNQYMLSTGNCAPSDPSAPADPRFKHSCRAAYILAAELTGTSQLLALLCAPLIGYFSDRYHPEVPLLTSGVLGFCSFAGFSALSSLSPGADRSWAFVLVAGMGIAQIGAIVSSLALVSRAVAGHPASPSLNAIHGGNRSTHLIVSEALAVNPMTMDPGEYRSKDRMALKGSIAGVYSLFGAIGILLLTKLGGWGADAWGRGLPFVLLAIFFALEVAAGSWLVLKKGSVII